MPAVSTGSSEAVTSWSLTNEDYILLGLLVLTLYMPLATAIYYARREMPSIRYRNPHQMTICGFTATFYCWFKLVFGLMNSSISCATSEYLVNVLFHFTTFSVFLSEVSIVATFYLTELLVTTHTYGHTPQNDRKSRLLHLYLKPSTALGVWIIGHLLWNVPSIAAIASHTSDINNTTLQECPQTFIESIEIISAVQVGILLVLGSLLTRCMSTHIDNFGLRSNYIYAHRVWFGFYFIYVVIVIIHDVSWAREFQLDAILTTLAMQSIVLISIVRPLHLSFRDRQQQQENRLKGSERLLEAFLLTKPGFDAFSAFCTKHCTIDKLIVWKATVNYQEGKSDDNSPQRLYRNHLRKDAPLPLLSMSNHLKDLYYGLFEANLKYRVDISDQDLDRVWFVPLRDELLKALVRDVLPHFQQDPLGAGWGAFLHAQQATQALDLVLMQGDDNPDQVKKALTQSHRPSRAKISPLATILDTEIP